MVHLGVHALWLSARRGRDKDVAGEPRVLRLAKPAAVERG